MIKEINEDNPYNLEPTSDFVFKRIFGYEDSKNSLISLLNAILDGNPTVKDLTILNTETLKEGPNNKASRLDIEQLCCPIEIESQSEPIYVEVETDNKTIVNVEVQCVATIDLYNRAVVYASNLVSYSTKKGESYNDPKVISIWIIRDPIKYGIMANRKSPIEEITYCTMPTKWNDGYEVFANKSRIIWVQLSKFNEKVMNNISEILKNWVTFFDDPGKVKSNDKGMKQAQYMWKKISSPEQQRAQMRAQEKYEMDKASEIYCAREEAKLESQKQIALNMKKQGFDDNTIIKCLNIDLNNLKLLLSN